MNMKAILFVISSFIILIGVWNLMTGLIPYPSRKIRKNIKIYNAKNKKSESAVSALDDGIRSISKYFVKYFNLTAIEKNEMQKALQISNMAWTPEEFVAFRWTYLLVLAAFGLVMFLIGKFMAFVIFRVVGIGLIALGVIMYVLKGRELTNAQKKVVTGIDDELPRFVAFIRTSMETSQESVLSMLERYTPYEDRFTDELKQTIADAKTSNFPGAMARFDQRINSDKLKMVLHGLVCANNGDNVNVYFEMLERDFTEYEINRLRQNVKTIPNRMKLPKMLMYLAVAFALFLPIIMQIVDSFSEVFSNF